MSLDGKWTIFQIEAEIDQFGLHRLVNVHNHIVEELKWWRSHAEQLVKEKEKHNI